jgi:putative ATP-dependent endonuclease of OLD family
MRLASFEITGHALLQDMSVEVRDHLVIIGANDVGKTSILRLLNLLLGASVQQLYQGLAITDIREGTDVLVVQARLDGFDADEAGQFPFAMTVEEGKPDYLLIRLELRTPEGDPDNVLIERFFPDSGTRRSPSREQLLKLGWRYLPANRSSAADYMNGKNSPFRTMLDSVELGEELADLGGLLDQFNDKLDLNPALLELRREIAAHLSRSIPRSYNAESLAIRTAADPAQEPLQDVTIFLREGDQLRGLVEQSDGMRQLMALTFFDLAQAKANIVAVDEPEIHLHPSSQRTVASLFAESAKQRLVVTHSPYVVQRFEPKHVLVVDPDSRSRQIAYTNFTAVEKEMLQWWSPQLLEGLTARRMLFVEGLADRIIVEAAAQALGISLDRAGVSVFALDGADKFSHVLKVVGPNGFDLPICGLCDEDREASWAGNLGLKPKKMEAAGFFIARTDLEHEYVRAIGAQTVAAALINAGQAREQGILQSTGAPDLASVTDAQLGTFLSSVDSRKVPAARLIAPMLTAVHIANSPSLIGLLGHVQTGV